MKPPVVRISTGWGSIEVEWQDGATASITYDDLRSGRPGKIKANPCGHGRECAPRACGHAETCLHGKPVPGECADCVPFTFGNVEVK